MRLCVNTSTFGNPSDPSLCVTEKIRVAAAVGFTHIELWNDELTAWTDSGRDLAELKRILDDAGLSVPSVISLRHWMETEGSAYTAAIDDTRRRMEQAVAVGAPAIVASPPFSGDWHYDLDQGAARYRAILELGDELGVVPMMEFLGFVPTVYLLEQAYAIAELADHPDACIVLDPFHMWRGGSGFGLVRHLPRKYVGICHFNDAPAGHPPRFEQRDADRVYPGDGCLPLVQMLRDLAALGYDGPLSLELFNPSYWALPIEENLHRGMATMRSVMAEAGLP